MNNKCKNIKPLTYVRGFLNLNEYFSKQWV